MDLLLIGIWNREINEICESIMRRASPRRFINGNPTRERGRIGFVLAHASGFQNEQDVDVAVRLPLCLPRVEIAGFCFLRKR